MKSIRIGLFAALTFPAFLAFSSPALAVAVGDKAPALELKDVNGMKISFKPGENVAFVNFWATWCAPCASEFPKLNELAAQYKGKVKVMAISLDDKNAKKKIDSFVEKRSPGALTLTLLSDPDNKSAIDYDVNAMPTSFIVDRKGVVRYMHRGFDPADTETWRKELDALLK